MIEISPWSIETNHHGFIYILDHAGNKICCVYGDAETKMQRAMAIADLPRLLASAAHKGPAP